MSQDNISEPKFHNGKVAVDDEYVVQSAYRICIPPVKSSKYKPDLSERLKIAEYLTKKLGKTVQARDFRVYRFHATRMALKIGLEKGFALGRIDGGRDKVAHDRGYQKGLIKGKEISNDSLKERYNRILRINRGYLVMVVVLLAACIFLFIKSTGV